MKLYNSITVDLYNPYPLPRMSAQQHNVGRGALITLTANGQVIAPNDETIRIFARRPDGNVSYLDCAITEDGKIQADFTDQMLATEGNVQVELEFTTAETNITTPIFIVEVNKSNVKEGVESSNEYKALEKYTVEAKEAAAHALEVYDNIPNYEARLTELEIYKANSILSKSSGTTVSTTDSAKVCPKNIKLFGKSSQKTYEGNQLLDVNNVKTNLYGTIDDEGYVTFEYDNTRGTTSIYPRLIINTSDLLQPNTSYALVTEIVEVSNVFMFAPCSSQDICQFNETIQTGSSNIKTGKRVDIVTTLDDFGECECAIRCGATIAAGASGKIKFRLSIIADTTVTADTFVYEPFVGNEPSPSLVYPQKVTPIGEGGSVVEKVLTTQFYDVSKLTNPSALIDSDGWITISIDNSDGTAIKYSNANVPVSELVEPSKQYLIVCEVASNTLGYSEMVSVNTSTNESQFITSLGVSAGATGIFTKILTARDDFTDCKTMLRTVLRANIGMSGSIKFRISIIKDTTVTADTFVYEPYSEQTLTLQTPNGLHGLQERLTSNYTDIDGKRYIADYIDLNQGKRIQYIQKFVYDCTTFSLLNGDMSKYTGVKETYVNFSVAALGVKKQGSILCTKMPFHYAMWTADVFGCDIVVANRIDFTLSYTELGITKEATSDERTRALKTWLANNSLEFYAELAEPIITDLTEEEKAQLDNLVMNYPNTTIVNDEGAYMEVEYVCDTQEHIKQNYVPVSEFEDLKSQVAEIQAQLVNA